MKIRINKKQTKKKELRQLREIAKTIGSIFCYGNFKAETYNERKLEKLLRENGTFWEAEIDYFEYLGI